MINEYMVYIKFVLMLPGYVQIEDLPNFDNLLKWDNEPTLYLQYRTS